MLRARCGEPRFVRMVFGRPGCRMLIPAFALLLAACGGGSSSGAGTANSPFVGTYNGTTTVTVSSDVGSRTVSEPVTVLVNRDGLVQIADAQSTVYASAPLEGDSVVIDGDAAALVDPGCTGTITLAGVFEAGNDGGATFQGGWSSVGTSCFGIAGTIQGSTTATRVNPAARASRVFETASPVMQRAFGQLIR